MSHQNKIAYSKRVIDVRRNSEEKLDAGRVSPENISQHCNTTSGIPLAIA
jgi:hypothetical protein